MRVSLDWLREYAVLDAPLDTLVQGLIDTGTEVDRVLRGPAGVMVARVVHLEPVPESTKGVIFADIDVGAAEPIRVLTGAPNLHVGDMVPYAPPGTLLPGWDEPLGVRAMFGGKYHSPGMLCSAAELGVGEDAGGIHHLERGLPGQPVHEVLALDTVLEVEVTTNRPDCLCHVGIAREMAAAVGETVREPDPSIPEGVLSAASMALRADVAVDDPDGCPRFAVRIIENVAVGPSPEWMQRRLRAVGLRPINNVVDVTNYVAHEIGQPLHSFDLDRFIAAQGDEGHSARVVVRRGRGEPLLCLDGVQRTVGLDDLAVCAGDTAVSIGGVIGGEATSVNDSTHNVLLEAATWDGPTIRATSKRLGVRTDASALNEKDLSDTLPPIALDRAAALIADLGGGHVLKDSVDIRARALDPIPPIDVTGARLSALLGYPVDATEAATALAHLGFGVEQHGDDLTVTVPHFRRDVTMVADVVEEVGRSLGYDRVPSTLPGRRTVATGVAAEMALEDRVKEVLVGAGFDEAITWSFLARGMATAVPGLGGARTPIPLRNPLSEDWSVLRTSLLPGVVQAVATNLRRGVDDVRLFELGRAFWEGERRGRVPGSADDEADARLAPLPAEPLLLSGRQRRPERRAGGRGDTPPPGGGSRLAIDLGAGVVETEPADVPWLHPGRGPALCNGQQVGVIGELTAESGAQFELRARVAVLEVRLDVLVPPRRHRDGTGAAATPGRCPGPRRSPSPRTRWRRRAARHPRCRGRAARERGPLRRVPRPGAWRGAQGLDLPPRLPGPRKDADLGGGIHPAGCDRGGPARPGRRRGAPISRRLSRASLGREAEAVARDLIGASLVVDADGPTEVRAQLVEVEAYLGNDDPASHAFRGPTPRASIMFGRAGHLYVYFSYGMHHCANVVCGPDGTAAAVLLRAAAVTSGEAVVRARRGPAPSSHRLLSGPGNLCRGLGIGGADNGADLCAPGRVHLEERTGDVPVSRGPAWASAGPPTCRSASAGRVTRRCRDAPRQKGTGADAGPLDVCRSSRLTRRIGRD